MSFPFICFPQLYSDRFCRCAQPENSQLYCVKALNFNVVLLFYPAFIGVSTPHPSCIMFFMKKR